MTTVVASVQVPAASTSQPATSTSTAPTTSSSSPDLNGWINLPPANSSTRSNPARDQQLRKAHQTFEAVMAFDGLAPEVINGRAASELSACSNRPQGCVRAVLARTVCGPAASMAVVAADCLTMT